MAVPFRSGDRFLLGYALSVYQQEICLINGNDCQAKARAQPEELLPTHPKRQSHFAHQAA
jgi:hypothetical protein